METLQNSSILLVEDHLDTQLLMRQILKKDGARVHAVGTGHEAFEYLRNNPAPDLILLDLTLPEMTGEEFLSDLRKTHPDLPVLIISGWDNLEERAAAMGANGSVRKPFSIAQLHQQLDKVFPGNSSPKELR